MLRTIINLDTFDIKWDEVQKIPEFQKLNDVGYHSKWHTEGSAMIHTQLVVEEMTKICVENNIGDEKKLILIAAALFHDIGKGVTGSLEDGDWHFPKHAPVGEQITRSLLWDEDFLIREAICSLVKNHMKPLHFCDYENPINDIIFISHSLMPYNLISIEDLILLKRSDCLGAKQLKEDNWRESLDYMRDFAKEYDCLDKPFKFFNNYCKFRFFNDSTVQYPTEIHDDNEFDVYVMIGLPGSGKNKWIEKNLPNLPIVSRDDIRKSIGIKGEKPHGTKKQENEVTAIFKKQLLEHARKKETFIINNTNLLKITRLGYQNLLIPYKCNFMYVYCEAFDFGENLKNRQELMSKKVLQRMKDRFEFPSPSEYHEIIFNKW